MVCLHPGLMGGGVTMEALWEGWPWNTLIRSYKTEDFISFLPYYSRRASFERAGAGLNKRFHGVQEKGDRAGKAESARGVKERSHKRDKDIGFSDPCWDGRMDEARENMVIKRSRWLTKDTDWSDNVSWPGTAWWSDKQSKLFRVNRSFCPYQLQPQETRSLGFYFCSIAHSTKHSQLI